jgi:hypothetical protein
MGRSDVTGWSLVAAGMAGRRWPAPTAVDQALRLDLERQDDVSPMVAVGPEAVQAGIVPAGAVVRIG